MGDAMRKTDEDAEHRLAVLTSWGLFGSFSLAIVATGFRSDLIAVAAAGYLVFVAGFVSHLVINRIYGLDFRRGEVASAVILFGVAAAGFMAYWAADPDFTQTDVLIGILGIGLIAAGFVVYLATRFGMKGAFSMFHIHRDG